MLPRPLGFVAAAVIGAVGWDAPRVFAQDAADCRPYSLNGPVLECAATGTPRDQLRTGTFIAGSESTGEAVARAMALEVATAPYGSSSGGFTFDFDPATGMYARRAGTFGPAFSERALTIGQGRVSAGANVLVRSYDRIDGLDLDRFDVFRFSGGTLPVTRSTLELEARTETIAVFANVGILDNFDLGAIVPYQQVSVSGTARLYDAGARELQRVLLRSDTHGIGDVALFAKYRFWTVGARTPNTSAAAGGLAAAVTARFPTGSVEKLTGLGLTRVLFTAIGSTTLGRLSPHVNVGYEVWSGGFAIPKDFQGLDTIDAKDQVLFSAGLEIDVSPRLSVLIDVLGRQLRGAGRVGYQPFTFPANPAGVTGAEALVAVPGSVTTGFLAPGAKWNVFRGLLITANALVAATDHGLRARITPVIGLDYAF